MSVGLALQQRMFLFNPRGRLEPAWVSMTDPLIHARTCFCFFSSSVAAVCVFYKNTQHGAIVSSAESLHPSHSRRFRPIQARINGSISAPGWN